MGLARKYTNLPLELLNTHADMDHIAGNGSFRKFFMHPGDIGQFESSFGTGFEILPLSNGKVSDMSAMLPTVLILQQKITIVQAGFTIKSEIRLRQRFFMPFPRMCFAILIRPTRPKS